VEKMEERVPQEGVGEGRLKHGQGAGAKPKTTRSSSTQAILGASFISVSVRVPV
jgi:hypothetical protein